VLDDWQQSIATIQEYIEFLKYPNLTEQDICHHLVTNSFKDYGIISSFIVHSTDRGTVKTSGQFGITKTYGSDWMEFPIDRKVPVTDAIKENKIVWVNTLPYWSEEYRELQNFELDNRSKTFIAVPYSSLKYPKVVLGLFSDRELSPSPVFESLVQILSNLSGIKLDQDYEKRVDSLIENNKTKNLTRRQKQIVNLLMQENSNPEIADFLGYSISTIKQEISKIYSELGVRNREDLITYLSGFTSQLEKL
jgi:DNA-binding CsgD family transcriptional regulator